MQGFLIQGICAGFSSTQSGDYTNHRVGITVTSKDAYGNDIQNTIDVDVNRNDATLIGNQANQLRGKEVQLAVKPQAFNGKNGAWLKVIADPQGMFEIAPKSIQKAS